MPDLHPPASCSPPPPLFAPTPPSLPTRVRTRPLALLPHTSSRPLHGCGWSWLTPAHTSLGAVGCDGCEGVVLQPPGRMAGRPALWKSLNCLVNLLSASAVAAAAMTLSDDTGHAALALPVLGLLLLLLCAATAGLSGAAARKVLHVGTSLLVVHTAGSSLLLQSDHGRLLLLVVAAAATAGGALRYQL
jgi:hypothetical protein